MGADFVVDRLTPGLLIMWGCVFVALTVIYYWHWRRYFRLYMRRQTVIDLRSKGNPWEDWLLRVVQPDPEVDLLRRKARRYLWYATIWMFTLLPLTVALFALAFASGTSR